MTKDDLYYCIVDNSQYSDMEYHYSIFCSSYEDYLYLPSKYTEELKEVFGNPICTLEWGFDESIDSAINAIEQLGYIESKRLLRLIGEEDDYLI